MILPLAGRGMYAIALIKKRRNFMKSVPGDIINSHFSDKDVGNLYMFEADTEDDRPFYIFCFKNTDYLMKFMALWMTLDDLEGNNMKRNYKVRDGHSLVNIYMYWQPFGLKFRYRHKVDDKK